MEDHGRRVRALFAQEDIKHLCDIYWARKPPYEVDWEAVNLVLAKYPDVAEEDKRLLRFYVGWATR